MAWDQSNHIYPLNRSQVNLKLERYVCARDWFYVNRFPVQMG